jgi:hypothetical protein
MRKRSLKKGRSIERAITPRTGTAKKSAQKLPEVISWRRREIRPISQMGARIRLSHSPQVSPRVKPVSSEVEANLIISGVAMVSMPPAACPTKL